MFQEFVKKCYEIDADRPSLAFSGLMLELPWVDSNGPTPESMKLPGITPQEVLPFGFIPGHPDHQYCVVKPEAGQTVDECVFVYADVYRVEPIANCAVDFFSLVTFASAIEMRGHWTHPEWKARRIDFLAFQATKSDRVLVKHLLALPGVAFPRRPAKITALVSAICLTRDALSAPPEDSVVRQVPSIGLTVALKNKNWQQAYYASKNLARDAVANSDKVKHATDAVDFLFRLNQVDAARRELHELLETAIRLPFLHPAYWKRIGEVADLVGVQAAMLASILKAKISGQTLAGTALETADASFGHVLRREVLLARVNVRLRTKDEEIQRRLAEGPLTVPGSEHGRPLL